MHWEKKTGHFAENRTLSTFWRAPQFEVSTVNNNCLSQFHVAIECIKSAKIDVMRGLTPTAYSCQKGFRLLSSLLKPWPEFFYECNGDYRKETFLEEHIGGPLYAEQKTLPKLPIPSIDETVERFLPTALPLEKSEEAKAELKTACRRFPKEAQTLQQRLLDYRDIEMKDSSWLQLWWNQMGYLKVRDSLVYNVSYFLQLQDDPSIEASASSQVLRAASLLFTTAKFREEVCSGLLPPDRVGRQQTLLCSSTFKYLFNACRVPLEQQDSYCIYDPSKMKHVIVVRKGHFFSFDFVNEAGVPLPTFILEQQLQKCIEMADQIPSTRPRLGLLTSLDRDSWAKSRETLIKIGGERMQEALMTLQSGSIVLSLDNEIPKSLKDCSQQFLSGGQGSSHNRWYDKSINLIVTPTGKTAVLCEHSMIDGTVTLRYADRIASVNSNEISDKPENDTTSAPAVSDIFADIFAEMAESSRSEIALLEEQAHVECRTNVDRHSNVVNTFDAYGSDFIKTAGHSPDAFVQMAIHLAAFRLFGEQAATYEATQVRTFLHGRTETTRSVSLESAEFVEKMGQSPTSNEDNDAVRKEKLELLKNATTAHSRYSANASRAQGVDRHFFGLSALVEGSEITPSLYSNSLFNHSKRWRSVYKIPTLQTN
ncbi:unnamed protein product [Cylindrotheca closterium]|uniref:Choline/carnitine acyltransferase domain-containing protein n=1 Tax=Cylindrotheca closterium TaxID=2856 RepID=A0AAD2PYA5_9STRA|nr:unnamed protein product [Cylindrotheca closterium]